MHAVYDYLQRSFKTGPLHLVDGQPQEKPFQEYPKWVTDADGKRQIVRTLQEEIRVAGKAASPEQVDPLQPEKDKIAAEGDKLKQALTEVDELKVQMKAQLAELEQARAALQGPAPAVVSTTTATPAVKSK